MKLISYVGNYLPEKSTENHSCTMKISAHIMSRLTRDMILLNMPIGMKILRYYDH